MKQIFPLTLGTILLIIGLIILYKRISFKLGAIKSQGRVVEILKRKERRSLYHYPKISYDLKKGEKIEFYSQIGYPKNSPYKIGDIVNVIYNPVKPEHAYINTFFQYYILAAIVIFTGVLLIFAAIIQM